MARTWSPWIPTWPSYPVTATFAAMAEAGEIPPEGRARHGTGDATHAVPGRHFDR